MTATSALFLMAQVGSLASNPSLGIAEGRCRADEDGPAFMVSVAITIIMNYRTGLASFGPLKLGSAK